MSLVTTHKYVAVDKSIENNSEVQTTNITALLLGQRYSQDIDNLDWGCTNIMYCAKCRWMIPSEIITTCFLETNVL